MSVVRIFTSCLLCCASLGAQSSPEWRFLELSDGLSESFIRNITIAADGRAWIRHSGAPVMSVFDGYRAIRVVLPGGNFESRIHGTKSGVAWTVDGATLHEYRQGTWKAHQLPLKAIQITASSDDGAFCLFPDRVAKFRAKDGALLTLLLPAQARVGDFREIAAARDGGIWVFGSKGAGHLNVLRGPPIPVLAPALLASRLIPPIASAAWTTGPRPSEANDQGTV